jgi:hypothetical protein
MSHWAEIDENNIVLRVLVGDNNDPAGDEGYQWLIDNLGGTWVQTSYTSFGGKKCDPNTGVPTDEFGYRYNYAGVNYTYDPILDAFISPKPADYINEEGQLVTYVLDEETCLWKEVII